MFTAVNGKSSYYCGVECVVMHFISLHRSECGENVRIIEIMMFGCNLCA